MSNFMEKLTKTYNKGALQIRKSSPEIFLGLGIVGFAGTIYLTVKAVRKVDQTIENHYDRMDDIPEWLGKADNDPEIDYTEEDAIRDEKITKMQTAVAIAKDVAPVTAVGAATIGSFLLSYGILKKRYNGVVAAFNAVSAAYALYRSRVVEEYGDKMDRHFLYGTKLETVERTVTDENGKKKKVKEEIEVIEKCEDSPSIYARWFEQGNPNWDRNHTFNMMFLKARMSMCNDRLHAKGHLFLNEVYDSLGFEHTPEGAVVGWIDGGKDNFVDFGIFDARLNNQNPSVDQESRILLDFNVDGIIWDKIGGGR